MVQVPVGSDATARSRWLSPVKAPVAGTTSRVRITRKNVLVVGSYKQVGSVTNGPCWPVVRSIEGGYPKNGFSPTTPVCADPSVPRTWMASLTASTTCPLPTHSPWSGGSRLNWLPPLVSRCWRWLIPSKLARTCGPLRVTLFGAAALATPAAGRLAPAAPCLRLRLRFGPAEFALAARAAAAPAASAPSWASGPKAFGISVDMAAGAPLPSADGLYEAEPAFWIWRVLTDGAGVAADALMLPVKGNIPAPMTSAATAESVLRLCNDIPRSLTLSRRVQRGGTGRSLGAPRSPVAPRERSRRGDPAVRGRSRPAAVGRTRRPLPSTRRPRPIPDLGL